MRKVIDDKLWLHVLTIGALLLCGPLQVATAFAQDEPGEAGEPAELDEGADTDVVEPGEGASEAAELAEEEAEEMAEEDADEESEAEQETARAMGDALGVSILGVASVIGGIAFMVESGDSQDLADQAGAEGDLLRRTDLEDRADRERALGITLTSLGIVMIGVATWLWIDYLQTAEAQEDDFLTLVPSVDPRGGAGLFLGGRF